MEFKLGQKIIDKIRGKKSKINNSSEKLFLYNSEYGKIYFPYYFLDIKIHGQKPDIYNKDGGKMDIFFIRDMHCAHEPYMTCSKYFLWDRFNIGLDTHFYTHQAMLETMGNPTYRYGWLFEAESIVPEDYKIFDIHKGLEKDFDAIFTYDEKILNKIDNAKFYPCCATIWYGKEVGCAIKISHKTYEAKSKNVSIIASNKTSSEYHKIRHAFANKVKQLGNVDTYGRFDGSAYLKFKADSLQKYRYQIVVENGIYPYYFTEKIMDCFASHTVPIYLGATKIDDFFNSDGIIKITAKDIDNIEEILKQCTGKNYEQRLPAIIDNYNCALKYLNMDDYLYEHFFMEKTN